MDGSVEVIEFVTERNGFLENPNEEKGKERADINSEENKMTRETWNSKNQNFFAVLGAIIGMGNVWRFPYICYRYGGGAFLLPYLFCVLFIGFPLFFLETSLGQYTKQGAIGAWNLVPLMRGVGIGSAFLVTYSSIYFIVIIAWAFFYLFHSFTTGDLPFNTCDNPWNTKACRPYSYSFGNETSITFDAGMNVSFSRFESIENLSENEFLEPIDEKNRTLPIEEFWYKHVLRKSSGLEEYGTLENWVMVLCLIAAWVTCYLCIIKGINSAGKVAMFTATFPYVLLGIILVRGCTLPGAIDGIYFYLKPNISKLAEPQVWVQAGGQVCYSYAIGFAAIITMGSFNEFHKDCYKHSMVLVGCCAGTSFFAGFTVFSILGNLAFVTNRNISEVVESGPGLVFQTFPTALSLLPLPHLWNILFFFMLIIIGLDSQFACVECMVVLITDYFPSHFTRKYAKEILRTVVCGTMLILGLMFIPPGGVYVFELFNNYAVSGIAVLWIALMEAVTIAYFYGIEKFFKNINDMIGYRPSLFIKIALLGVTPLLTAGIMIFYIAQYEPLTIEGYKYPRWADGIGWIMCMSSLLCVPAVFVYTLYEGKGTLKQRWHQGLQSRLVSHHLKVENLEGTEEKLVHSSTEMNGINILD